METTFTKVNFERSYELKKQGQQLIAGFTQTMMKKPEQFSEGNFPVYIEKGQGAEVTDVDGNTYIDFICGLGANTLGHNHEVVVNAILDNLKKGIIHSLPTPIEVSAAQIFSEVIPGAEMVRFFKTGADANSAAIRLARAYTGKEKIVTVGYNGWHDQYMFDTPGVPQVIKEYTYRMPLFTPQSEAAILELIQEKNEELAAVLLSVPYNRQLTPEFMQKVRSVCTENKVLLIMDEVMSGFRLALGGAQEYFGIKADLATFSKAIAAGMPLSAITGSRSIMSEMEKLQVSTTFGGEMLSLEVCKAVLQHYRSSKYIEHITSLGAYLKEGVNTVSKELGSPLQVVGYDSIPMFLFDKDPEKHVKLAIPFLAEMSKRGIIMRREVNFICGVHTKVQINKTIAAVKESLIEMRQSGVFSG